MDTRWHYVNDLQNEHKLIGIKFIKSEDNVSDLATKNVNGATQERHLGTITADRSYVEGNDNDNGDMQIREDVGEVISSHQYTHD